MPNVISFLLLFLSGTPRRYSRLKKCARGTRGTAGDLPRTYRNRTLTQRRVEADATRGNWIRDFDQFRRQRRFAMPGANPEFTVRITTRLTADFAVALTVQPARKEAYKRGIWLFRFATYSWFLLNADALQLSGIIQSIVIVDAALFYSCGKKETNSNFCMLVGNVKGFFSRDLFRLFSVVRNMRG